MHIAGAEQPLTSRFIKGGGVQWKQGVVIYMMSYTSLSDSTTPIHCTPLPLHPPCNRGQRILYYIILRYNIMY